MSSKLRLNKSSGELIVPALPPLWLVVVLLPSRFMVWLLLVVGLLGAMLLFAAAAAELLSEKQNWLKRREK